MDSGGPLSALSFPTSSPKIPGQAAEDLDERYNVSQRRSKETHDGKGIISNVSLCPFKPILCCDFSDLKPCDTMAVTCWALAGVTRASHEDTTRTEADCAVFLFAGRHFNLLIGWSRAMFFQLPSAFIRILPSACPCFVLMQPENSLLLYQAVNRFGDTREERKGDGLRLGV
jgi:hypothetical protein